jgi:Sec-independent protein translocase protein TatA
MVEIRFNPATLLVMSVVAVFPVRPEKLPELGEALAEGIRNFKDALKSD